MLVTNAADYFFFLGIKNLLLTTDVFRKGQIAIWLTKGSKKMYLVFKNIYLSNSADPAFIAIAYTVKFG